MTRAARPPAWVWPALGRWYAERVVVNPYASIEIAALLYDASAWFLANGREGEELDRWVRSKRFAGFLRAREVQLVRWGSGLVARGVMLKD